MAMTAKAPYAIDRYVIEPLMRDLVGHDRKPSAYLIYLAILGQNENGVRAMSYQELADFTGLSPCGAGRCLASGGPPADRSTACRPNRDSGL